MAAPSTSVLDSFNRANESPIAGSWTAEAGTVNLSSNQATAPSDGANRVLWNSTLGADQEGFLTVAALPVVGQDVAIILRSDGSGNEYWLGFANSGGGQYLLYIGAYTSGGTFYSLVDSGNLTGGAAGHKIWGTVVGNVLTLYDCPSGSSTWTQRLQYTDTANWRTSGKIGMMIWESTARVDDFGGGAISSGGTTYGVSSSLSAASSLSDSGLGALRGASALSTNSALAGSARGIFARASALSAAPGFTGSGLAFLVASSAIQAASALAGAGGSLFAASASLAATLDDMAVSQVASLVAQVSIIAAIGIAASSKANMASVLTLAATAQAAFYGNIPGVGKFIAFIIDDEPVTFFV
jgi:hypothetical protein